MVGARAGLAIRNLASVFLCARSSVWIERLPPEQKAVGSNPTGRTKFAFPFHSVTVGDQFRVAVDI